MSAGDGPGEISRMNCEDSRLRLGAYSDGELAGDDRSELEAHLEQCGPCRTSLEELRRTWDALDAYTVPEPRVPAASRILQRARARERRTRLVRVGSGIAAVLVVGILIWQLLGTGDSVLLSPADEQEIVTHWDVLDILELLESLEVLENMELLEEMSSEALNGSENG